MNSQHTTTHQERPSSQLKFGIDRLLASDSGRRFIDDNRNDTDNHPIYVQAKKAQPSLAVPCSDCVTSLFRCCSLGSGDSSQQQDHGFLSHHHPHNGYNTVVSSPSIYSVQPIRPFVSRPGMAYFQCQFL